MFSELFAGKCPACGGASSIAEPLCAECFGKLKRFSAFCHTCGYPLSSVSACCMRCERKLAKKVDKIFAMYAYSGVVRSLILDIKFKYNVRSALTFEKLLAIPKLDVQYDAVVAVPCHFLRRFRRLIHPTDIAVRYIAEQLGVPESKSLRRARNTGFQFLRSSKERATNVKDAFTFDNVASLKNILLVDDIFTTGSTVNECALIMKASGVKRVDCFVVAKG